MQAPRETLKLEDRPLSGIDLPTLSGQGRQVNPLLFSVVIPAYEAADFITATLDSVAAQTFRRFEVIIVDDGSQDNSAECATRWAERHPAIRSVLLRQRNQGPAAARNAAIRRATGDYVALLDADDMWAPDKLAAMADQIRTDATLDVICHDAEAWSESSVVDYMSCGPHKTYERLLFGGNCLIASATTVRRSSILEAGGFREDLRFKSAEDYDLWLRLARTGCKFEYVNRPLTRYRMRGNSLTRSVDDHCSSVCNVIDAHLRDWPRTSLLVLYRARRARAELFRACARMNAASGHYLETLKYVSRSLGANPFCVASHAKALARRYARAW